MYTPQEIQKRLKSQNADERRVAMVMIGKARHYHMLQQLIDAMHDDLDTDVRAMAAWAIDMMGSVDAIPALIDAMYDPSFSVRSNAGWALVHLGNRFIPQLVLPEVIAVLRDEDHAPARQMAYLILSRIHDRQAREAIDNYW